MVKITLYQENEDSFIGFDCIGHAGYGDSGQDIVCAGISALVINAINTIEYLTAAKFTCVTEESTGKIDFQLTTPNDSDAQLVMKSLELGLQGIKEQYGKEFFTLDYKEV